MHRYVVVSTLTVLLGVSFMRQRRDTDVLVEAVDENAPIMRQSARARGRTLAGSQTNFTKGDSTVQTVANAEISGDSAITVMFGIQPTGSFDILTGFGLPRAYANIQWLVNGIPVTRLVSVFSGQQITGVGDSVSIQVWDDTIVEGGDPNPTYPVTCILAPGTRGSNAEPPLYWPPVNVKTATAGLSASFQVPQNVGMRSFKVFTDGPLDMIEILAVGSGTIDMGNLADFVGEFIPFPDPRITSLSFLNNDSVDHQITIVFGVDG